ISAFGESQSGPFSPRRYASRIWSPSFENGKSVRLRIVQKFAQLLALARRRKDIKRDGRTGSVPVGTRRPLGIGYPAPHGPGNSGIGSILSLHRIHEPSGQFEFGARRMSVSQTNFRAAIRTLIEQDYEFVTM